MKFSERLTYFLVQSSFVFFVAAIVSCQQTKKTESTEESKKDITWEQLSSKQGNIEKPGVSNQQTASLILDIDKDGINDFVVAARKVGPSVMWFKKNGNSWKKYTIDTAYLRVEAGGAFHDIDQDGDLDIVFGADAKDNQVWWWENPYPNYDPDINWTRRLIKNDGANKHHDELFGDFDGDGVMELAFWNQQARNLCLAEIPDQPLTAETWKYEVIYTWPEGKKQHEGLAKADVDQDGVEDIIGGGSWFKFEGTDGFKQIVIDSSMGFSRSAAEQLVPGGTPEVIFAPGDADGYMYWYSCSGDPFHSSSWEAHQLLDTIVIHGHSIDIGDINKDGHLDIFTAEMHTPGHKENAKMRVLYGNGQGSFEESVISVGIGNHESRIADLDGDGDLDILNKPYTWDAPRVDIWLNNGTGK